MIPKLSDLLLDNTQDLDNNTTYPMNCVLKINQELCTLLSITFNKVLFVITIIFSRDLLNEEIIFIHSLDKPSFLYLAMYFTNTEIIPIDDLDLQYLLLHN